MQDAETRTLWNHITGEAVQGPLVGRSLGPMTNLLHMTVSQALKMDAGMQVAISSHPYTAASRQRARVDNPDAAMADRFAATLVREDPRRPRMEIGLGVWIGNTARYYPMSRIRERREPFIDRLGGRSMLIYIDAESNTPAAVFVNARGERLDERPTQMFTRWYGFAVTFPATEIFGGP